jgi:hypothetical protein
MVMRWRVNMDSVKVDDSLRPRRQMRENVMSIMMVRTNGVSFSGSCTSAAR